MSASAPLAEQTRTYFDTLWNNRANPGMPLCRLVPAVRQSAQQVSQAQRAFEPSQHPLP